MKKRKVNMQRIGVLLRIPIAFYFLGNVMSLAMGKFLRSSYETDMAYECHQVELCSDAAMLFLAVLMAAMFRCRWLVDRFSPVAIEALTISFVCLTMTQLALAAPKTAAKISGYTIVDAFGEDSYGSDSTLLLKVDLVVAGAHYGLPVRWHMLLFTEILAISLYVLNIFVIGSEEPFEDALFNLLLLTGIVVAASLAKRIAERGEREDFLDIIKERSLRCQAEFKLSAMGEDETRGADPDRPMSVAELSSVPETAVSNHVFRPMFDKGADLQSQLALMAQLGSSEHWCIEDSEVTVLRSDVVGRGSFGVVVKGVFCGMLVAVKCPLEGISKESSGVIPDLCNEFRILRTLRHPNIVTTHGAIINPEACKISVVLELVDGMRLDDFIRKTPENLCSRYQIMVGVCRALVYMHSRRPHIVHGDLKSSNIMIVSEGASVSPKLLDFGLSRLVTRTSIPLGGTMAWLAPEVLTNRKIVSCKADIFSFGRILNFVGTGIPPCAGLNPKEIKKALQRQKPPQPTWPLGCVFAPYLKQLVRACLRLDASRRPPSEQVYFALLQLPEEMNLPEPRSLLAEIETVRKHVQPSLTWSHIESARPAAAIAAGLHLEQFLVVSPARPEQARLPPAAEAPQALSSQTSSPLTQNSSAATATATAETEQLASVAVEASADTEPRLLHPERHPTEAKAMVISLVELVTTWNCTVEGPICCNLHAGLRVVQRLCGALLERPCFQQEGCCIGGQCANCGMLGYDDDVDDCPICRSVAPPPRNASNTQVAL